VKTYKTLAGTLTGVMLLVLFLASCEKRELTAQGPQGNPVLPSASYDYQTKHGVDNNYATLGRVLFYDKSLSVNNTTACGSCHKQEAAFATNNRFDRGFDGQLLTRNSPSIQGFRGFDINSEMPSKDNQEKVLLFWDGRQSNLSDMVLNPVLNHKEMSMPDFAELTKKLSALPYYPQLFTKAFGDATITKERVALALESFISCLNTSVQPEERKPIVSLDQVRTQEDMGQFLFHNKYNCAECHDQQATNREQEVPGGYGTPPDPAVAMFNIGLDATPVDKGLGRLTGLSGDMGMFKVPTLQNVSVTAPYMHDGRFASLDQVLDHYSHGIKMNPNLSVKFRNIDGTAKELNISPVEKTALIAFLKTLRNDDFLTSPMYSDPFKQ
jgi:cytochrome c peroxidase